MTQFHRTFDLYLTNKPLKCNKSLCWMKDPDIRSSIQIKVEQPSCVQPAVYVGKSWDDLNDISLGCHGTVISFHSRCTPCHSDHILLPPANEVCEGCFHRYLSVHRGTPLHTGIHHPWADTPLAQCMLGYGQQAGGTHPNWNGLIMN